jgi:hypothetical protein
MEQLVINSAGSTSGIWTSNNSSTSGTWINSDSCSSKTPLSEFASELNRPSDRRLSAKWLPTFCGYMVPRGQRDGPYSRFSRQEPLLFYQLLSCNHEAEWTPFQTHYFFMVVPGIEPGPPDLQPRTLTTRPQRRSSCTSTSNNSTNGTWINSTVGTSGT